MRRESPIPFDAKGLTPESEPFPYYPVIIPGGAGATGEFFTRKLARQDYAVYVGTRDAGRFEELQESIINEGGVTPLPFVADITNPDHLRNAYEELGLEKGAPVHYFPFAAAGYESLKRPIMRPLVRLIQAYRNNAVTKDLLTSLTEQIKAGVQESSAVELANATNRDGLLAIASLLRQNGHLQVGSIIGTLSSTISDYTDPDHPENFQGPWLYYPIGISKAQGVKGLREIAENTGATHIDFVAPEIRGTGVGDFFAELDPIFEMISKFHNEPFKPPIVTKGEVANAIYQELTKSSPSSERSRKVYIKPGGVTSIKRPKGWEKPLIPYL